MSTSFTANQYENAFQSNKLGNWEKPSNYREEPVPMSGSTKIIANDRGHLIDGVPKSKTNPWGNFVGTWDLPKNIPGNSAGVPTARSTYAQEKLQKEADDANKVMGGNTKNQTRSNTREGPRRGVKGDMTELRSGAEAPGSKMFPGSCSPQRQEARYTPIGDFPHAYGAPVTPAARTPTPQQPTSPCHTESPIPGVPDIPEVLAQQSREPTPDVYGAHGGISAF